MPRATQSKESTILAFFKTAELPIADLVLTLAKEAVGERKAKSEAARAAQKKIAAPAPVKVAKPAPVTPAVAAPRKKKKKSKAKATGKVVTKPTAVLDGPELDNLDQD